MNWLLRQLKDAPDGLRVDAYAIHSRAGTSALLKDVRSKPDILIEDPKRELRTFRVALSGPMGTKRSQGRGSFVASVLDLLDEFYRQIVQNLKAWTPAPPKLRPEVSEVAESRVPVHLLSTAISSQDDISEDAERLDDVAPPVWHTDRFDAEGCSEPDEAPSETWDDQALHSAADTVPIRHDGWLLVPVPAAEDESAANPPLVD